MEKQKLTLSPQAALLAARERGVIVDHYDREDDAVGPDFAALRELLHEQTRLLDGGIETLSKQPRAATGDDLVNVVTLMAQAVGVSIHSILLLTKDRGMGVRDCIGIARSVHELALNACFVIVGGIPEAQRAIRHAQQKSYRNFDRRGAVGGYQFEVKANGLRPADEIAGMEAAMAEFSARDNWPSKSPSERIAAVEKVSERAGLCLAGAHFSAYRLSSELLHGSYFGVIYFWMGSKSRTPPRTRVEFDTVWGEHLTLVFSASFFSALGLLTLIGETFDVPELVTASHQLIEAANRQIELLNEGAGGKATVQPPPQAGS